MHESRSFEEQSLAYRICDSLLKTILKPEQELKLSPEEFTSWFAIFAKFLVSQVCQGVYSGAAGADNMILGRLLIANSLLQIVQTAKSTKPETIKLGEKSKGDKFETLAKDSAFIQYLSNASDQEL
jgi:hypothetical protein